MRPQDNDRRGGLRDEDLLRLFTVHAGMVRGVALAILREPDAAEDVVGEVFARLARSRKPRDPSKGYFMTAARNEALHLLSRQHRSTRLVRALATASLNHDPGPQERIERDEQHRMLGQLLMRLPTRCRQIMELIVYEGLTQGEVADRLQITRNAVEKQVDRARRLLKAMAEHRVRRLA
ncbi:MAG: RNA polymerase sigma factor [Longimicrobiales bacterium]